MMHLDHQLVPIVQDQNCEVANSLLKNKIQILQSGFFQINLALNQST